MKQNWKLGLGGRMATLYFVRQTGHETRCLVRYRFWLNIKLLNPRAGTNNPRFYELVIDTKIFHYKIITKFDYKTNE